MPVDALKELYHNHNSFSVYNSKASYNDRRKGIVPVSATECNGNGV